MSAPFVRPDVAAFVTALASLPGPRAWEVSAAEARAMTLTMKEVADLPTGELAVIRDLTMPGPGGDIPLRLFDARPDRGPGPVLVFLHGGGWTLGDIATYTPVCAEMARQLDVPIVSVGYRLAPENPWPAAPDDAEAASRWIASAPAALGLAPTGLLLAGDSAGGNLALIVALALRDAPAAAPLLAQWAIYPATDFVTHYPSYTEFAEGYLLTRDAIRWFGENYAADGGHWRASPIKADPAGLPPTLVTTAGLDPIRDQGRAYAAALANAGVDVTFREARGTIHGFIMLRRAIPSAVGDLAAGCAAFRAIFTGAAR